jgi:hypothetical protein
LALVEDGHLWDWFREAGKQPRGIGLLRVNRRMNEEATAIFYGQSQFSFTGDGSDCLASTLRTMGRNATLVRNIRILFPDVFYRKQDEGPLCTIDMYGNSMLSTLQDGLANVRTLTALVLRQI